MSWRQYENIFDDLKNVAFKATLAPFTRKINSSRILNKSNLLPGRIVICGCPRSGTTLMNELFRCYDDVCVGEREEYALRFPYLFVKNKYIVTKHPLDYTYLNKIIDVFNKPLVVFLLRDPRDVIISKHFKNGDDYLINFPTWRAAAETYENFNYEKKILVRYESLLRDPDTIQKKIAEVEGLNIKYSFNEFHNHVVTKHQDIRSLGGIRPIDPSNLKKYMRQEHFDRIKDSIHKHPDMADYLIKYGYEKDKQWEAHFLSE